MRIYQVHDANVLKDGSPETEVGRISFDSVLTSNVFTTFVTVAIEKLYDKFGRPMEYMRLAVTDRCNLRCFYCMPHDGAEFVPRKELLTYEEMLRLTRIMVQLGVNKVRITGGEPFVRKNMYGFLKRLAKIEGLDNISITTNGAVANRHIPFLKEIGVDTINLSLDTLDKQRYEEITRRDFFDEAMSTYRAVLDAGMQLKVNMVVMADRNKEDILPMAMLTKHDKVNVRFIEEMPFNGAGARDIKIMNHLEILDHLKENLPPLTRLNDPKGNTSMNYQIEGHQGTLGIIAAYSRTFCGECNRVRVTATGNLINCLYDEGVLNLKRLLSDGSSDQMIREAIAQAYLTKRKDGFEAEKSRSGSISESMSAIGG
jgi:molybdenum cofactor biosynthesis protein A